MCSEHVLSYRLLRKIWRLDHFFPGLRTTRLRIVPPCRQLVSWIPGAVSFQVGVFVSVHKRTSRTSSIVLGRRRREFQFYEIVVEFLNGVGHLFYLVDFILMFTRPCCSDGGCVLSTCDCTGYNGSYGALVISSQAYSLLV